MMRLLRSGLRNSVGAMNPVSALRINERPDWCQASHAVPVQGKGLQETVQCARGNGYAGQ